MFVDKVSHRPQRTSFRGRILFLTEDTSLIRQRRDKVVDLCHAHVTRMTLLMVQDKLSDPADVGLFGAEGVMAVAEDFAVLIEQLFGSS